MDGDGDLDLMQIMNKANGNSKLYLYENLGSSFATQVIITDDMGLNKMGKLHSAVGDIDGDGLFDFVINVNQKLTWYRNTYSDGVVSFETHTIVDQSLTAANSGLIYLVDYNNDRYLDIVYQNAGGNVAMHVVLCSCVFVCWCFAAYIPHSFIQSRAHANTFTLTYMHLSIYRQWRESSLMSEVMTTASGLSARMRFEFGAKIVAIGRILETKIGAR